jgi:hypothetical protein
MPSTPTFFGRIGAVGGVGTRALKAYTDLCPETAFLPEIRFMIRLSVNDNPFSKV